MGRLPMKNAYFFGGGFVVIALLWTRVTGSWHLQARHFEAELQWHRPCAQEEFLQIFDIWQLSIASSVVWEAWLAASSWSEDVGGWLQWHTGACFRSQMHTLLPTKRSESLNMCFIMTLDIHNLQFSMQRIYIPGSSNSAKCMPFGWFYTLNGINFA